MIPNRSMTDVFVRIKKPVYGTQGVAGCNIHSNVEVPDGYEC